MKDDVVPGLDADLRSKLAQKHDSTRELEARAYISAVLGDSFPTDVPINVFLHDGTVLCRLLIPLLPNTKYSTSKMPFKQMENIDTFLKGATQIGVPAYDLFQTVDLYESKNIPQVIQSIHAFSRYAAVFNPAFGEQFPPLGPKLAKPRVMSFTPQQLDAGKNIVNTFQYGYTGGSNASGVYFGKRRDIGGAYEEGTHMRRSSASPQSRGSSTSAGQSPTTKPQTLSSAVPPSVLVRHYEANSMRSTPPPPPPAASKPHKFTAHGTQPEQEQNKEPQREAEEIDVASLWERGRVSGR